jgi:hypothetical protein
MLHSIDLPPLAANADSAVGSLIPDELRSRWSLHRGPSSRLLGPLIQSLGAVDIFVHDSLHTYANMYREFSVAWPALRAGGVVVSDDIECNSAFARFFKTAKPVRSLAIQEELKSSAFGLAVKGG